MAIYLLRRLGLLLLTTWVVFTAVFFLIHMVPGDPVEAMLGERASDAELDDLRHALGLDLPVGAQYTSALRRLVLHGDLGVTARNRAISVQERLAAALPATLWLACAAMAIALGLGVPLGVLAAVKRGTVWDRVLGAVSVLGVAMPGMWIGPLLMKKVSVEWDLLPLTGWDDPGSTILPAFTLGASLAAFLSRITRASMARELEQDYVRTAAAKGASPVRQWMRHALRNALIPIVTVVGLQFGALLTGAVITEKIFRWPGLGSLLLEGIDGRDYPLVQGCVLVIALVYALVNLGVDLFYAAVDPRVRLGGTAA